MQYSPASRTVMSQLNRWDLALRILNNNLSRCGSASSAQINYPASLRGTCTTIRWRTFYILPGTART